MKRYRVSIAYAFYEDYIVMAEDAEHALMGGRQAAERRRMADTLDNNPEPFHVEENDEVHEEREE